MEDNKNQESAPAASYDDTDDSTLSPAIVQHIDRVVKDRIARQDPKPESLWKVTDVANYLNVSVRTVETLIAEQVIRPLWIRGSRRFTPEAIRAYISTTV